MANDTTRSPWILDTASSTPISTESLRPRGIRWVGVTTAGHECKLTEADGRVKWHAKADAANREVSDVLTLDENLWDGIALTVLGSGTVYLEFGLPPR